MLAVVSTMAYSQNAIAVYQKDGQIAKFDFTEKPVVTYSGSDLILTTTKTTIHYPVYMLQKIAFDTTNLVDGIDDIELKPEPQFSFQGATISISGGEAGEAVCLYDISGRKVAEYRLDSDGRANIPLQTLGKNLYILKTKTISFKFRKS